MRYLKLLVYLHNQLDKYACNHDFKWTRKFCALHNLREDRIVELLRSKGASCDCEVIHHFETEIDAEYSLPKNITVNISENIR